MVRKLSLLVGLVLLVSLTAHAQLGVIVNTCRDFNLDGAGDPGNASTGTFRTKIGNDFS